MLLLNRIVIVTAPDKPGLVLPDEAKLKKVLRDAEEKELKAYVARLLRLFSRNGD